MKDIDLVWSITKHFDYRPRVVARGLDDVDSFLDDDLGISDIIRRCNGRKQGDIDPKRL